ncbi:MAG: LptF/LptG family permease, partial [Planctomycetales bacterium]|nr:LptF/LptG family permease [Planctomycetales bacterium]
MPTIARYVLVETLKTLVTVQLAATVLLMLCLASQEAMRKGLPPQVVVQLMPALAIETLQFTLPGCMLFAVCATFGRMASTNEMTALKSLGIQPWCVVWPVLMLALVASVGSAA